MFCNKCGKQIPDGSAFCSFCGASLNNVNNNESSGFNDPNTGCSATAAPPVNQQQHGNQFIPVSVLVNLMTGSGMTVFSSTSAGTLEAGPDAVSYEAKLIGVQRYSHSYLYSEIAHTEMKMTHLGLMPQAGYIVTLKDGKKYTYIYSPIFRNKILALDEAIKSKIN